MNREFKQENKEFYNLFRELKKKYKVKNQTLVEKLEEKNINTLMWSVQAKYISKERMEQVIKAINENLSLIIAEKKDGSVNLEVLDLNEL